MAFDVEAADLDAYGAQVGRAGDDAQSIKEYVAKYGKGLESSGVEQGLFLLALGLHEDAMTEGEKALSRLDTLLESSSKELSRSSSYYRQTDEAEAQRIDGTYPGSQRSAPTEGAKQSFTDGADPTAELTAPATPPEFSHGPFSDAVGTLSNWLSPTYWSLEAVQFVFQMEKDPLEQALSWFTGDWASYVKCGEMWANSGSALKGIQQNLTSGNAKLDAGWNGNAADAAYVYFTQLATEIAKLSDGVKDLQTHYANLGLAVFEALNLIKGILTAIADSLILIEIEIAVGTLLAETGVGAIVGYGLAILEVIKVMRLWNQATETYAAAEQSVKIAVTAAALITGGLGVALENLPVPGESYDHPAV